MLMDTGSGASVLSSEHHMGFSVNSQDGLHPWNQKGKTGLDKNNSNLIQFIERISRTGNV